MFSHNDLVLIGLSWLKKMGFPIVASEIKAFGLREIPDVIGFRSDSSLMIECKCSLSDFRADFKKIERINPADGIGNYRLYLAPKGMISLNKIPLGWGLLEVDEKGKVLQTHFKTGNIWCGNSSLESPQSMDGVDQFLQFSNPEKERAIMYSLLRRGK